MHGYLQPLLAFAKFICFKNSLRQPIWFFNSGDKTKFSCNTVTDAAPQFLQKRTDFVQQPCRWHLTDRYFLDCCCDVCAVVKRPSWLSKRPSWLSNVLHRQQFFDEFLLPSLHSSYPVFIISTELSLLKVDAYISSPLSTLTGPFILIFFYEFASVFILFHFC